MGLPFTSVVSYHTNANGCGVAKFGKQLAERLGVPFVGFNAPVESHPLFSLKASELDQDGRWFTFAMQYALTQKERPYSVFWHDAGADYFTKNATHVFYADPSLGSPGLFCPSLITPRKRTVRLFSFGMAHKLQTDRYKRVRELLDAASQPYHLRVSVGLHEGTSLDGAEKHFDALKEIMGEDNVTILGILSDDAVSEELANADYVLAFFENGLRANNTTVHAAINADCKVIANCDDSTPPAMRQAVFDIRALCGWPRSGAFVADVYSWDRLIQEMKGVCERSQSRAV